jgi:hypothetical protein
MEQVRVERLPTRIKKEDIQEAHLASRKKTKNKKKIKGELIGRNPSIPQNVRQFRLNRHFIMAIPHPI